MIFLWRKNSSGIWIPSKMNHPFFDLKDVHHGQQKEPLKQILFSSKEYFFVNKSQ